MINKLNNWFDRQNHYFKTFIIINIRLSVLFCLFSFIVLMNVVFGIFVVIPIGIIVCAIVTTIEWIVDNSF